jgi:protein tyrosine phosphatase (PTP) superfamily phosphohydrolase (DUF442 family)
MSKLLDALAGVTNACEPLPGLVTGGQPLATHLAALARAGCAAVIDTRDPMEPRPIDEPAAVRAAGMEYVNIPVPYSQGTDEPIIRLRAALATRDPARGVLVHCNSGNRVGGALIPYLMLDAGMDEAAATHAAMRIGIRDAELIDWGLSYVHRARPSA